MNDSKYCKISLEYGEIHCLPVYHGDGRITYDGPYTIIAEIKNNSLEDEFYDVISGEKIYVWPFFIDEYTIDHKPNILVGNEVQMLSKSDISSITKQLEYFKNPKVMNSYMKELNRIKKNRMESIKEEINNDNKIL